MQVDYSKIPEEMRGYNSWLVWRYEDRGGGKPTKIPYNPRTGKMVSVTDPTSWCSFNEALCAGTPGFGYDGIGFVLSQNDPYVFVDLDATQSEAEINIQTAIFKELDSYSEYSPSGKGLHIIVRGENLPKGRRRSNVELYSTERYMTMTGAVFHDKPIADRNDLIKSIWGQMAGGSVGAYSVQSEPQYFSDADIIQKALNAVNGQKFSELLDGNWQYLYPSQSEADISFIDILAFYTQNVEQIIRIFWGSPLGQRAKAGRIDYVMSMIHRSFDRMLPPVDLIQRKQDLQAAVLSGDIIIPAAVSDSKKELRDSIVTKLRNLTKPQPYSFPPGLVGDIAQFIYDSSPYPAKPVALVGALGLTAGIVGRCYNVSGTGLNLYLCLLAKTGVGKESISRGMHKIMNAVTSAHPDKTTVPAAQYFIGPSEFASGQGLLRHLTNENQRCFVSLLGEFGLTMQKLAHPRASSADIMLKKIILELYNKSGKDDVLGASSYAQKENNTAQIKAPAVSIIGETTPSTFYAAVDERLILDGLLPRFIFVEHDAPRPRLNKKGLHLKPSQKLISDMIELTTHSLMMQRDNACINVKLNDEAELFFDTLEHLTGDFINATENDALRDLWSRAYVKVLKLAACVAVGNNRYDPVIDVATAEWAYNIVAADILTIHSKFEAGEIGRNNDENKQTKMLLEAALEYINTDFDGLPRYGTDKRLYDAGLVPYSYFQRRLSNMAIFRTDMRGSKRALQEALSQLIDSGDLQEVGKGQMIRQYKFSGRAFLIGAHKYLPPET